MASREDFLRVEQEFQRLSEQLAAGQITRERYDAALKELMIQDAQGRYWTIGANTGKWYMNDGTQWVEAAPPQEPSGPVPVPPAAPVPPMAPIAPQPPMAAAPRPAPVAPKSGSRRWIAFLIAVILVFCLCICLACVALAYTGNLNYPFNPGFPGR